MENAIPTLDDMIDRLTRAQREMQRAARISAGEGSAVEQLAAAQVQGREVGRLRDEITSLEAALDRARTPGQGGMSIAGAGNALRRLEELRTDLAAAEAESQRLGQMAIGAAIVSDTENMVAGDVDRARRLRGTCRDAGGAAHEAPAHGPVSHPAAGKAQAAGSVLRADRQ
jgi:hypothetical protein